MKKILLITQYFPPDMAGTGRVAQELAEDLLNAGYDLEVIAGMSPHFNEKGYKDYTSKVPVKRIWYIRFNKNSKIGRLFNFLSFPMSLLVHLFIFRKADIVIMFSNPPTIVAVGAMINLLLGKGVHYILQDIYPDLMVQLQILSTKSLLTRGMRHLNTWGFYHMEKIVVLSESMNKYVVDSYRLKDEKVVTIPNWADTTKIYPASKDNPWSQVAKYVDKFVVLYAGNIGLTYNFQPVLEAAEYLKDDKGVVFLFIGEGGNKRSLQEQVVSKKLKNVHFMSYVAEGDYNKLLASSDCHIVIHSPGMDSYNLPGKVYSYFASGRPVIAISDKNSELSRLISESKAGITVSTSEELQNIITKLKENQSLKVEFGREGRDFVEKYYSRKKVTAKYVSLVLG